MAISRGGTDSGDSDMENYLKEKLGYTFVKRSGKRGGGCISQGEMYHTDQGQIFVKENAREDSDTMFRGELASLEEIHKTGTVKVPRPITVLERPSGAGPVNMDSMIIIIFFTRSWIFTRHGVFGHGKVFKPVSAWKTTCQVTSA